jgi:hypothetical protein
MALSVFLFLFGAPRILPALFQCRVDGYAQHGGRIRQPPGRAIIVASPMVYRLCRSQSIFDLARDYGRFWIFDV